MKLFCSFVWFFQSSWIPKWVMMLEYCKTKENTLFWWLCITPVSVSKYNAITSTQQPSFCFFFHQLSTTNCPVASGLKNLDLDEFIQHFEPLLWNKETKLQQTRSVFQDSEKLPESTFCVCVSSHSCVFLKYKWHLTRQWTRCQQVIRSLWVNMIALVKLSEVTYRPQWREVTNWRAADVPATL